MIRKTALNGHKRDPFMQSHCMYKIATLSQKLTLGEDNYRRVQDKGPELGDSLPPIITL